MLITVVGINDITKDKVAIKILSKKWIKHLKLLDKIKREIKLLKLINHPHIIKVFDYLETRQDIYVVMEFAQGGELFEVISRSGKVSAIQSTSVKRAL